MSFNVRRMLKTVVSPAMRCASNTVLRGVRVSNHNIER